MLGALITFVGFILAISWWVLYKQFRKYIKGEETMPVILFVIFCVLSIVVLGFILTVVFSVLPNFFPRSYRKLLDSEVFVFGSVFVILFTFIAYQCYQYVKIAKQNHKERSPNYTISSRISEIKQKIISSEKNCEQNMRVSSGSTSSITDDVVRFCKYCGKGIDLETIYCPYCGKKLQEASLQPSTTTLSEIDITEEPKESFADLSECISPISEHQESSVKQIVEKSPNPSDASNVYSGNNAGKEKDNGVEKEIKHEERERAKPINIYTTRYDPPEKEVNLSGCFILAFFAIVSALALCYITMNN